MMIYGIQFDSSGNPVSGWEAPDSTYPVPSDVTLCTEAQNADYLAWTLVSGSLVQSLPYAQAVQSALIKQGFANAVAAIPFTVNGTNYTLDTAQSKQPADMAIVVAANQAVNHPVAWVASTAVAQYAIQLVGSSYLFCTVAGTTGTVAPTPPTTFGTAVTDGTVTWEPFTSVHWLGFWYCSKVHATCPVGRVVPSGYSKPESPFPFSSKFMAYIIYVVPKCLERTRQGRASLRR